MLAVVDGALDREDLTRMIKNGGEGHVEWNERCRDLAICRSVDKQGDVHDTQPMTEDVFIEMFKMFLIQAGYSSVPGYLFQPGSIHMIRRELGKQLDGESVARLIKLFLLTSYQHDILRWKGPNT